MLATLMIASLTANAKSRNAATSLLECGFTEPFFTLMIDLKKKEISKIEPDWSNPSGGTITTVVATNINVVSDLSDPFLPKYKVLNGNGSQFAEIVMNMAGSDGMSDIVYPYEIKHDGMFGGCSSDKIKRLNDNQN